MYNGNPYLTNPNADYYAQMARGYASPYQQYQPQQQYQPPQSGIVARSVTSIEEARGIIVDPLSIGVFTDLANGKVYVKRIDNSGLSSIQTFTQQTEAEKTASDTERITALEKRIAELEGKKAKKEKTETEEAVNV